MSYSFKNSSDMPPSISPILQPIPFATIEEVGKNMTLTGTLTSPTLRQPIS